MKKLFFILTLSTLTMKPYNNDLLHAMNKFCDTVNAVSMQDFPISNEDKSCASAAIAFDGDFVVVTLKEIDDKKSVKTFYNEFEKSLTLIITSKQGEIQVKLDEYQIEIKQRINSIEEIHDENGVIHKTTTNVFHSSSIKSLPVAVDIKNYTIEKPDEQQQVIIKLPKTISQNK